MAIEYIQGHVIAVEEGRCVVLAHHVGYGLSIHQRMRLPLGQWVRLWAATIQQEHKTTLFGFPNPEERMWFYALTGVQGIGGRMACNILGLLPPPQLHHALVTQKTETLRKAEGVGPRLAQRMIHELGPKLPTLTHANIQYLTNIPTETGVLRPENLEMPPAHATDLVSTQDAAHPTCSQSAAPTMLDPSLEDTLCSALGFLGYHPTQVRPALLTLQRKIYEGEIALSQYTDENHILQICLKEALALLSVMPPTQQL